MPFSDPAFDPDSYLKQIGSLADNDIDVGTAAIALASYAHIGISLGQFTHHLETLAQDVLKHHEDLMELDGDDNVQIRLQALVDVIVKNNDYDGSMTTLGKDNHDISYADFISVMQTRRGNGMALALLYMHCAQVLEWDLEPLSMPAYCWCRIEYNGQRIIFDPADDGRELHAGDLRKILKHTIGPEAELSANYFEGVSNRDMLVRLQNFIKLRLVEQEHYAEAAQVVEKMRWIAPDEYRLLLDAGVLYARTGQSLAAARALEGYIDKAPKSKDRQEAAIMLQQIRETLQ